MRSWLDSVDEATANYPNFRKPTRVERFISDYFSDWVEDAKIDQERRRKSARENIVDEEQRAFHGFGGTSEETWEQWLDCVNQTIDPESDDAEMEKEVV